MRYWSDQHFLRRIILMLDLAAVTIGFVLAILCRFTFRGLFWNVKAYSNFLVISILICISLNLFRRVRNRQYMFTKMDPAETLSSLIKDRTVQYVLVVLLLYAIRTIDDISRFVILLTLLFDLSLSIIGRFGLRSFLLKEERKRTPEEHYIILTARNKEYIAVMRLQERLPENADIVGVLFAEDVASLNDNAAWEELQKYTKASGKPNVFLYHDDIEVQKRIIRYCRSHMIPVHVFQFVNGQELPGAMTGKSGTYVTVNYEPLLKEGEVFGVRFAPTDVQSAVYHVLDQIPSLYGKYICFSNVHTTVMAYQDADYRNILNGSAFTFADGRPIAGRLFNNGFDKSERVAGPDFMDAMFRATMDGRLSHYFYGSSPETIAKLEQELHRRYPGLRIAGMASPPFRPETKEEDDASVAAMNASGAAFIWIGLGAPKQEKWMSAHRGRVEGVMLGVGAGFDFYAGTVKRAPKWVQKIGMEWLYRLFQDPKRLANRYIVTNVRFLWYSAAERIRRENS